MHVPITVTVNGVEQRRDVEPRTLLVQFLRDDLGLTGAHIGCETSQCGACTVLIDGQAVKSCTLLAVQADGASGHDDRGARAAAAPPSGAEGVLGRAWGAVRVLHPRHGARHRRPAGRRSRPRARTRSGTAWRATSAAAPAITTSCARCKQRRERWPRAPRRNRSQSRRRAGEVRR